MKRILVVCTPDFQPMLWGGAEAIRTQLQRLGEAGREVWFYANSYQPLQLYLASACSRRVLHPLGSLSFLGLARSFLFFKRALGKANIDAYILRRGEYKSAGDRFRTDQLDSANRLQYQEFFDSTAAELQYKICAGFGKSKEELNQLQNGLILPACAAESSHWIDEVKTLDRLEAEWKEEKYRKLRPKKPGRAYIISREPNARHSPRKLGIRRKKLAVLVFEGAIIDGKSKQLPLLGQALGSESFVPHIRSLEKDKSVKGVVLRVNSGGGSASASEDILDALSRLKEKKPLVVSMGEVAGSGGYWIACRGERLFAHHSTLTGSIGVISIFFYLEKFLKKHGVTVSSLKSGPYADLGSVLHSMDKKEREIIDAEIERVYQLFLERVAEGRGSLVPKIDALAKGRVWAGESARAHGLVDEIGGIEAALAYLKGKLELPRVKVEFYPRIKHSFLEKQLMRSQSRSQIADPEGVQYPDLQAVGALLELARNYSIHSARGLRPFAAMPEWWLQL